MRSEFKIISWDESPYLDIDENAKFTRATIRKEYTGRLQGEGHLDYLMAYNGDGSATFVGIERFTGIIEDKTGSFSLKEEGTFAEGLVKSSFTVIEGSATDELVTLCGRGKYETGHAPQVNVEFEYTL
jgi:hypothetical protein